MSHGVAAGRKRPRRRWEPLAVFDGKGLKIHRREGPDPGRGAEPGGNSAEPAELRRGQDPTGAVCGAALRTAPRPRAAPARRCRRAGSWKGPAEVWGVFRLGLQPPCPARGSTWLNPRLGAESSGLSAGASVPSGGGQQASGSRHRDFLRKSSKNPPESTIRHPKYTLPPPPLSVI